MTISNRAFATLLGDSLAIAITFCWANNTKVWTIHVRNRTGIKSHGGTAAGVAGLSALIPDDYIFDDFDWELAAHKLGHMFGLQHDFRVDEFIISYGSMGLDRSRLSECHADFCPCIPTSTSTPRSKRGSLPPSNLSRCLDTHQAQSVSPSKSHSASPTRTGTNAHVRASKKIIKIKKRRIGGGYARRYANKE